ncbi:MAG: hypothetical protein M0020_05785 [Actinomycetota bacterium]|nr:hypothetical protein [Actinomycetota bacterium]
MRGVMVCDRCSNATRNRFDVVEVRTELRALASQRRIRTWRTALVCRSCAEALAFDHDHPDGRPADEQGALW